MDSTRMVLSMENFLDTTSELAAHSAVSLRRAKEAGPARRNVSSPDLVSSLDSQTKHRTPPPIQPTIQVGTHPQAQQPYTHVNCT